MSLLAYTNLLLQNGRIFRYYKKANIKKFIKKIIKLDLKSTPSEASVSRQTFLSTGLNSVKNAVQLQARKLLINNVLERVTPTLNSDLKKKAAKRLFYGDSAPFFALVGVSLASGSGLLTKDDELEGICWEIRVSAINFYPIYKKNFFILINNNCLQEAVSKGKWNDSESENVEQLQAANLDELDLGEPIAKGCNAVVYSAKLKNGKYNLILPDNTFIFPSHHYLIIK